MSLGQCSKSQYSDTNWDGVFFHHMYFYSNSITQQHQYDSCQLPSMVTMCLWGQGCHTHTT